MNNYFNKRKTIRNFSDKEVSDELIYTIAEMASHAPTTGNMQLYSMIVTRTGENRKELEKMHFSQPASTSANVLITFCADFNRFEKWCLASDACPGYRNFHSFVSAVIDTVCFTQQFNTIAEIYGLGCCYLGTTTYNAKGISELLQLPDLVVPVATLAVGYPSEIAMTEPQVERLPISSIMHNEKYEDYSEQSVKNSYAEKESLDVNRHYVEVNGKKTLAQVFTDIRYPQSTNEELSHTYYEFIESKGFKFPDMEMK